MNNSMTEEEFIRLFDETVYYNIRQYYPKVLHDVRRVGNISTNCHNQRKDSIPDKYLDKYCRLSSYIARIYNGILANDKSVTSKFGRSRAVATLAKALMDKVNELDDWRNNETNNNK